jgi:hypothetical protein
VAQQPASDYELRGLNFPMRLQPDARRLMEGPVGVVARRVIREVIAARREGLPVAMLEVARGPEPLVQDWEEAVIRVSVLLTPREAVAAWDALAQRVEALRESLDMVQKEILDEAVGLHLVWKDNGNGNGAANGPA